MKKGCIKNIKYIMLKHYKQDHLPFCQSLVLPQCNTNSNDTNYILSQNPVYKFVNLTDNISTVTSSSDSNYTNTVTLSSSNVDTKAIIPIFNQFNHF